jgi:immune inhibitor A
MKHILSILALVLCLQTASAFPALQQWLTVKQTDGTSLRVTLCGDEHFHYYKTADDVLLVRGGDGDYYYASVIGFGIKSTGVLAHEVWQRTDIERSAAASLDKVLALQQDVCRLKMDAAARKAPPETKSRRQARKRMASDGMAKRGLVILVSFSDQDFTSTKARWNDILNKEGFSDVSVHCPGSVHDYFYEQSSGKFNVSFDVFQVKLPKSKYYYGENDENINDRNVGEMVADACIAVKDSTDFSAYDWNGDGSVDQVVILYAGCSENVTGNDSRLIWPHEWNLSAYAAYPGGITLGGVKIDQYACTSELLGLESSSSNPLSGLGVFCHEFSHCLGLCDLYTYTGLNIIMSWDLMASGDHNNQGWTPPNYSSYEKSFCGWETPVVLTSDTVITDMASATEKGATYKIVNDCASPKVDEYYTLENRQQTGWDEFLPGHGLLVYHVDYDSTAWADNYINYYADHPCLMIVPANHLYSEDKKDAANFAYPYLADGEIANDSLTDDSSPSADVFNYNIHDTGKLNKPLTSIRETDGKISFRFGVKHFDYEVCDIGGLRYRIKDGTATLAHQLPGSTIGAVIIPASVEYQGTTYPVTAAVDGCFKACGGLKSVTFPKGITRIRPSFFYDCVTLSSILVDGGNPNYSSDGAALYNKDKSELVYVPKLALTDSTYTIPSSVTAIGDSAFYNINTLRTLNIPESVTTIGKQCFATCYYLSTVTLPGSVKKMGDGCFYYCTSLTAAAIPNQVTEIGNDCFYNCANLKSVTIPDGVTRLGDNCFRQCQSLPSVTIPKTVTELGTYCFAYCQSLTAAAIPDGVKNVSDYCFYNCSSLASVSIPESVVRMGANSFCYCSSLATVTIPSSVTELGDCCLAFCSSLKEIIVPPSVTKIGIGCFEFGNSLKRITLPNTITELPLACFAYCPALNSVVIPNTVQSIGAGCFYGCTFLSSITMPDSLSFIDYMCFYGCSALPSIDIPKKVASIGFSCFNGCTSLTKMKCHWQSPFETSTVFYGQNLSADTLYVPRGTTSNYQTVNEWSGFGTIIEYDDVATSVLSPSAAGDDDKTAPYYSIQGIKIQQPTQKRLYIHKGKKIIIH